MEQGHVNSVHKTFFKSDMVTRVDAARSYVRRKPRKCVHCGEMYLPPYGRVTNRFCGRRCYYAVVGQRPAFVEAACSMCGATFRRTLAALKRVRNSFCSPACQHAFHVGERSPMFRGDKDPNRGARWNRLADSIRERDFHACRRCGESGALQKEKLSVDHVRPWRSFVDKALANHPDNLVSLCRKCHSYKTSKIERAWLLGDAVTFGQWARSLHLPSAAFGWIAATDRAPVALPPPLSNGNREKTRCVRGHEFSAENTRVRYGKRECRECIRIRAQSHKRHNDEHVKRTLRVEGNADLALTFWRKDEAGVWCVARQEIAKVEK